MKTLRIIIDFVRNIDWRVAAFTTRLALMIIGTAATIGFLCTLKPFFFVVFILLSLFGWIMLYLFFAEMARRGRNYASNELR